MTDLRMSSVRAVLLMCLALALDIAASSCSEDSGDPSGPRDTGRRDTGPPQPLLLDFEPLTFDVEPEMLTNFAFFPGRDDLLALDQGGTVRHYRLIGEENRLVELGSFAVAGATAAVDCGLLSLAFEVDFDTLPYLFLGYCLSEQSSRISRYTWIRSEPGGAPDYAAIEGSSVEIITIGDSRAELFQHAVGALDMDGDGRLWALFGEKRLSAHGQDRSTDLGALIRIVPSREPGVPGYDTVAENPFVGVAAASDNIYAYGLRSPWQGFLDSRGRFWIGDVGENDWEEVNVVTEPGQNFGWANWEGAECLVDVCDSEGVVFPLRSWHHESGHPFELDDPDVEPTVARVAAVGLEYVDRGNDRYDGRFTGQVIYTDICMGWVRAIELSAGGEIVRDSHVGHLPHTTAWRQGPDGYVYVSTYGACEALGPRSPGFWRAVLR